jgi:ADP-ribosylglycohydrolase
VITAFLESENFENAIRKAVSIGRDSDTIACIAGGMAQAFYKGIPNVIREKVFQILDGRLKKILEEFEKRCRA